MLPSNRDNVNLLVIFLTEMIVGEEIKQSCRCCSSARRLVATEIQPSGINFPGEEMYWDAWSVICTCPATCQSQLSVRLDSFFKAEDIDRLFSDSFGNAKKISQLIDEARARYYPVPDHQERVQQGLAPAVATQLHRNSLRIMIDWGCEQALSAQLYRLYAQPGNAYTRLDPEFQEILGILNEMLPYVFSYSRGPDPIYHFEPENIENLSQALKMITTLGFSVVKLDVFEFDVDDYVRLYHSTELVFT